MESVVSIMNSLDKLDKAYRVKEILLRTWILSAVLTSVSVFVLEPVYYNAAGYGLGVIAIVCWTAGHFNNKRIEKIESSMKGRVENLLWVEKLAPRRSGTAVRAGQ